jgi:acetate kinase
MRDRKISGNELDDMLNHRSGLKGISGISSDLRQIQDAAARGDVRCNLAMEMFLERLKWHLGSMIVQLGGIDALVFTGGIGENSAIVRERTCDALHFMGLQLDAAKNAASLFDTLISKPESSIAVLIVKAAEEWAIAKECWKLMRLQ